MDADTQTQAAPQPNRSIAYAGKRGPSVSGALNPPTEPVIFFDGFCGLCNRFVDFVIQRDPLGIFHFAPLQGETARQHLPEDDLRNIQTMVLADGQGVFRKSTAAVRILGRLGGFWGAVGRLLRFVPRPLRDAGYSLVARNRYAIFGKKETCRIPTAAERARFLP
jgi:predicted DCC family thiol-disulfide oxidoreductase YuxK